MKDLASKDIKKEYTYFLDNASVHHSKDLKLLACEEKLHILYNVPYNSNKNPVEYVFSVLRKHIQWSLFNTID